LKFDVEFDTIAMQNQLEVRSEIQSALSKNMAKLVNSAEWTISVIQEGAKCN